MVHSSVENTACSVARIDPNAAYRNAADDQDAVFFHLIFFLIRFAEQAGHANRAGTPAAMAFCRSQG